MWGINSFITISINIQRVSLVCDVQFFFLLEINIKICLEHRLDMEIQNISYHNAEFTNLNIKAIPLHN